MHVERSPTFKRRFRKAPEVIQRSTEKALRVLLNNLRHPSLHAKIIDEPRRIWQARATGSWRIYFQIQDDVIILLTLKRHR